MHESIRHYMTASPRVIAPTESLFRARQQMQAAGIRHLPVLDGDKIVGIITERDIRILEGCGRASFDVRVSEAMTPDPYVVDSDASVARVCRTMADRKYGSAIVTTDGRIAGIFCAIDALRSLAEIFEEYFSAPTSDRYGTIISRGRTS